MEYNLSDISLLNASSGRSNTDYRHFAKLWTLVAILTSMRRILIFFSFLLMLGRLFAACTNRTDSFYEDYVRDDLYRMPVIYPYELTRLYGVEMDMGLTNSWDLEFRYNGDSTSPGFSNGVSVSEINVSNGIIYGYDYEQTDYPAVWFVVIPSKRVEKVFKNNKNQWINFLRQNNVSNTELFSVWQLFDQFKNHSNLPWYNLDKNIYPQANRNGH